MNFKSLQLNDRVFTALALALIASLLAASGVLLRLDCFFYDLGSHLDIASNLTFRQVPDNIVIVAIDEASLQGIGHWPWSRRWHTELVNKLSAENARVIGLDINFSEPELADPEIDQSFAQAINHAGNVVLPILLEAHFNGAPVRQTLPIPSLVAEAAALGRVHVPRDPDGVARSIYLWEGLSADGLTAVGLPHFSQSVLQVADLLPANISRTPPIIKATQSIASAQAGYARGTLLSRGQRKVVLLSPSQHFKKISYIKVLSGEYPPSFFKGKLVLIGATVPLVAAATLGDALPTLVSTSSQFMPDVEFHANAIAAMQHAGLIVDAPLWFVALLCALLAIIPVFWLPKLSPFRSVVAIGFYFLVVIVLAVCSPYFSHVWVAPSGALVAILFSYPIWSCRNLESAQMILDKELQILRDELASLGVDQAKIVAGKSDEPVKSRIAKAKLTAKSLRDLHRARIDTMAFISHDIRAPLGAAIMLLDEFEVNKYSERMRLMLGRAHNMSEGFLQVSRAEMVNTNKFHRLDMVRIIQQAADDLYEVAKLKQVKLVTEFSESSLLVRGDFGLLIRAVSNILLNAVNYSPENGTVKILLHHDTESLTLKVIDQGAGISPEKITTLFRRFSRVEDEHQSGVGNGLGLYFVKVTLRKHRGSVSAHSELGQGAIFVISMPLERRKHNKPVQHERRVAIESTFKDTL